MATTVEKPGFFKSPWATVGRIGFSVLFFFWAYLIWSSAAGLSSQLEAPTDRLIAIHDIQVEFKKEVQEWKNLLLRSNSQETFDKNWRSFGAQYQKVAAAAQDIIAHNDDRTIDEQMKIFVAAHAANYEQYKNSAILLIRSKFDSSKADAAVRGIDRPLLDHLDAAETGMLDEKRRLTENAVANARNQIEQSLFALIFIGMLAVWMPKY